MQRKYRKLKKRWNDVEKKIMWDAEYFHSNFAQQVRNYSTQYTVHFLSINAALYKDTGTIIKKRFFWFYIKKKQ